MGASQRLQPIVPHPDPDIHLWAQANFNSNFFPKWHTFFSVAITTYALEDHLTTATSSKDPTWLQLHSMVLHWLYVSMTMDIVDLIMPTLTSNNPTATT
jgi:hypothetical protein